MSGTGLQLVDIARDLLAAQRGDGDAHRRVFRRAVPLAADLLVRPGAGMFVSRGLEVLDEYRAYQAAQQPSPEDQDADGELASSSHPMDRFVRRFFARKFGFYVLVGEPGSGKTTLALRMAQRFASERNYEVIAVGGLHPDDRQKWGTDDWVETEHPERFVDAMSDLTEVMVEGMHEYPRAIKRRVILLDDASLTVHIHQAAMTRALLRVFNVYRHLDWIVVLTARTFKSIATVAENADARFLKRPVWDALRTEREGAREWWENAERAYANLKLSEDWESAPTEKAWVYVESTSLKYRGMLRYSLPGTLEPDEDDDDD